MSEVKVTGSVEFTQSARLKPLKLHTWVLRALVSNVITAVGISFYLTDSVCSPTPAKVWFSLMLLLLLERNKSQNHLFVFFPIGKSDSVTFRALKKNLFLELLQEMLRHCRSPSSLQEIIFIQWLDFIVECRNTAELRLQSTTVIKSLLLLLL